MHIDIDYLLINKKVCFLNKWINKIQTYSDEKYDEEWRYRHLEKKEKNIMCTRQLFTSTNQFQVNKMIHSNNIRENEQGKVECETNNWFWRKEKFMIFFRLYETRHS